MRQQREQQQNAGAGSHQQPIFRPENFVTGVNRRVYQAFSELLERGESIDLNQFSEKFTVPEMGYLAKYLTLNETMAGTLEEMEDYIHVIREASDQLSKDKIVEADPEKLQEYIKQRRNKQEGGNNR